MAIAEQQDLAPYLAPDELIQSDHPEIVALARTITAAAGDQRERAIRIFYWVRDQIAYCIEHDELRRQFQLLDVYVELLRLRRRIESLERVIVAKVTA